MIRRKKNRELFEDQVLFLRKAVRELWLVLLALVCSFLQCRIFGGIQPTFVVEKG